MINLEGQTKLSAEKALDKGVETFGPEGLGLKIVSRDACCVRFEGGGGFVTVEAGQTEDGKRTRVIVQGREYEAQIQSFVSSL